MEIQGGLLGKGSNGYESDNYGETARNVERKASQADAEVI